MLPVTFQNLFERAVPLWRRMLQALCGWSHRCSIPAISAAECSSSLLTGWKSYSKYAFAPFSQAFSAIFLTPPKSICIRSINRKSPNYFLVLPFQPWKPESCWGCARSWWLLWPHTGRDHNYRHAYDSITTITILEIGLWFMLQKSHTSPAGN